MDKSPTHLQSRLKRLLSHCRQHWLAVSGLSVLGAFLLYVLIGFFGVPLFLRHVVLAKANKQLVGTLEVEHFRFNPFTWELKVEDFKGLASDGEEAASFEELRINLQPSTVFSDAFVVQEVFWDRPDLKVHVNDKGELNLNSIFASTDPSPKPQSEPFVIPALVVDTLEVREGHVQILIESFDEPFEREVEGLSFVMNDLRSDDEHDNPYRFDMATRQGEQLVIEGTVRLDPLSSVGSIQLEGLQLADFSAFLGKFTEVQIGAGSMTPGLDYRFCPIAAEPEFGISGGRLDLKDVSLMKRGESEPFQQADLLRLSGLKFNVVERSVQADLLQLDGGMTRLIRDRQGGFNVVHNFRVRRQDGAREAVDENGKPIVLGVVTSDKDLGAPIEAAKNRIGNLSGKGFDVRLQELQINDHRLLWRDQSVSPTAAIDGRIASLKLGPVETTKGERMNVDLKLLAGESGSMNLSGSLPLTEPLNSSKFKLTLSDLPLSALSPYQVAVIGHPAKAGKLAGTLEYAIESGTIDGSNKLSIDGIELGPRDQDSDARRLPVRLGVELLSDADGVLQLDLPIKGDLGSPKFSFERVIAQSIANVLNKVVESPFRLLGGVFDGADDVPDTFVDFEAGATKPVKVTRKLRSDMAKVLEKRPDLALKLTPVIVPQADKPELGGPLLDKKLRELSADGRDRDEVLEQMYEDLPEEKQDIGLLTWDRTAKMEKIVSKTIEASDEDLIWLGKERGKAVKQILCEVDGIDAAEVRLADPVEGKKPGVRIGLELAQD